MTSEKSAALRAEIIKSVLGHAFLLGALFLAFSHNETVKRDAIIEVQLSNFHVHQEGSYHSPQAVASKRTAKEIPKKLAAEPSKNADTKTAESADKGSDHPAWEGLTQGQKNEYIASIVRLVSSHKSYPKASILNEEEGVVELHVSLDNEGNILKCEVVKPSGFTRLDEAAVQSVRGVGKLPLPAPNTTGVALFIPIRFELRNSR